LRDGAEFGLGLVSESDALSHSCTSRSGVRPTGSSPWSPSRSW
jgi:hypothetical protein